MSFESQIQKWVSIDNQLKILNDKVKELRDNKNEVTEQINKYVERNNLKSSIIQISDGKIKFSSTKVSESLTFKYIEKSLGEVIHNEEQVQKIVNYLKQNREFKNVNEIKRFSSNN